MTNNITIKTLNHHTFLNCFIRPIISNRLLISNSILSSDYITLVINSSSTNFTTVILYLVFSP